MPTSRREASDARLSRAARALADAIPALLALVLALIARHAVVEPAEVAHACDPAPWAGWCAGRTLLVYSFAAQGIGWLALAAGTLATLLRQRRAAQAALVAGSAGLVLYSFEPSAFGALLGLMVLVRVPRSPASLPRRGQPTQAAT